MPGDPKPFRCTACEILRERDTNHWWIVLLRKADSPDEFIELRQWNSALARRAMTGGPGNAFIYLACGLNCLMTLAGRLSEEIVLRHTAVSDPVVAQVVPPSGRPEAFDSSAPNPQGENDAPNASTN